MVRQLPERKRQSAERRLQERQSMQSAMERWRDRSHSHAVSRAETAARSMGHADVGAYLRARYVDDAQPVRVLIDELGVSKPVVQKLLDDHQVPRRPAGARPVVPVATGRKLPPEAEWLTSEAIRCLECGQWKRALGRHLNLVHGMTAGEYRAAWGMRQRQPLCAGYFSDLRREIANTTGGPERMRAFAPEIAEIAAAGRRGRERREQERRSVRAGMQRWWDRSHADAVAGAEAAARRLGHQDASAYLRARYLDQQEPIRVLCAELGVNKQVIIRLMDSAGIARRGPGPVANITREKGNHR